MTSKTSHETYLPQLSQCHVQHTSLHFRFFRRRVDRRNDLERLQGL
jgi:hypothetical protein